MGHREHGGLVLAHDAVAATRCLQRGDLRLLSRPCDVSAQAQVLAGKIPLFLDDITNRHNSSVLEFTPAVRRWLLIPSSLVKVNIK